jgi:hypothetical protein
MEQLVSEKVELFWKGIENGFNKRGQVDLINGLVSPFD